MDQPSLQDVSVPVTAHINGMFPGRVITVSGTVEPQAQRFSINLTTAADEDCDFALHFNPRFNDGNTVVRNTKADGNWQSEEREAPCFPFGQGKAFKVAIICKQERYKIFVNGQRYCSFNHRIPFHTVAYLKIFGDVTVQSCTFTAKQKNPLAAFSVKNPENGSKINIEFGNLKNHVVKFIGKPQAGAERFSINFLTESDDIAFHLNPRFSEDTIVRNSRIENAWGHEERELPDGFPFAHNSPFAIEVAVDKQAFHVKLNETHLFDFVHRIRPINRIKSISLSKDGADFYEILFF